MRVKNIPTSTQKNHVTLGLINYLILIWARIISTHLSLQVKIHDRGFFDEYNIETISNVSFFGQEVGMLCIEVF